MKKLTAKIGEYQKDGATKGRYINLGVVMNGDDGEYLLLDPNISLAGVLQSQNVMAMNKGAKLRDRIMVNMWEEDNNQQQQQQPQQQQYQQPAPQQQAPQQGYQQPQQNFQNGQGYQNG